MKEYLKELEEKYMFVLVDTAANNIIVPCKRYYLEVICKELGLWPGTTSSDTYILETMDPNHQEKSSETTFSTWNSLDSKKIACLTSSIFFVGLENAIQASFYRFII